MPNTAGAALQSKALTILEDQLNHEFLACKKAEHYAQTFENPALKSMASTVATAHRQRFDRMLTYLNSHA